jgi:nucleoid DNA-binding protein
MRDEDTMRELARAVAQQTGLSEEQALASIQALLDEVIDVLIRDGRIRLGQFGAFELQHRQSRWARNPRTGESVLVPDKYHARFRAGAGLKRLLDYLSQQERSDSESGGIPEGGKTPRRWWHFWHS